MGVYKSTCSELVELVDNYSRARLGLLEAIVYFDKFLPDGPKKENILNGLVDNGEDLLHTFVRG